MRRAWIAAATAAWLCVGLAGLASYVWGYDDHRGFAPATDPTGVAPGTVGVVSFYSPPIRATEQYTVYLPPGYTEAAAAGKRFPVLYLLHGAPGRMTSFTDNAAIQVTTDELIAQHELQPMILVMPAAVHGVHGDTEWANSPAGRWEDDLIAVVHDVDHRYATIADRQHRGIGGDSEGGYGAVNIALHHLGSFSVIESWSGYFTETRSSVFARSPQSVLKANSPALYVGSLTKRIHELGLRTWLYQGLSDRTPRNLTTSFAAALRSAGAEVHWAFFPGGHDWGLWRRQSPRMLEAADDWFNTAPR